MEAAIEPHTIAVLGVGRVGTAISRTLLDAGYRVLIAASGDPDRIAGIGRVLVPGAEPRWATDAVAEADLVVLAIPLHRVAALDPAGFVGKVVVDGMNYWPPVDGLIEQFEDAPHGTSVVVQALLPKAHVVKTFNHTGYHDLEPDRRPADANDRLALAVAGDSAQAVRAVARLIDRIGYDAVELATLEDGIALQPGGDIFGARLDAERMADALHSWKSAPLVS